MLLTLLASATSATPFVAIFSIFVLAIFVSAISFFVSFFLTALGASQASSFVHSLSCFW